MDVLMVNFLRALHLTETAPRSLTALLTAKLSVNFCPSRPRTTLPSPH